ncbi:hypothetical protein UCRPC4_g00283 [Phaeomoniella chlamydospora]|uniref:Uncharacterized protein n=1 Tax=Phaeomoniella chlamydospora TaxID=158046 RepID=A0A0G2F4A9_PHACM|nr:hypothetical protein UCRPC4_g00283 [Phaeomoniella chlamydospora]
MFAWLNGPGKNFKDPLPGSTNYLGAYDKKGRLLRQRDGNSEGSSQAGRSNEDSQEGIQDLRPFPININFYSQSILSEDLRNEIYRRVKILGQPVRLVSAQLGVELRRVGAVGKPLALPYARAVHEMVPTTPYTPQKSTAHEPINDLPVHAATHPQMFWPTSESRAFNRTDAGRAFSGASRLPDGDTTPSTEKPKQYEMIGKRGHEQPVLLPADARIPHPHLIEYNRDLVTPEIAGDDFQVQQRYNARIQQELDETEEKRQKKQEFEEKNTTRVETERWDFLFKDVQVTREGTGLDGRGTKSPGFRYGVPSQDRKRGQHKIPRKVQV